MRAKDKPLAPDIRIIKVRKFFEVEVDLINVQMPPPRWSLSRSRRQVAYPGIDINWSVTLDVNHDSVITAISQLLQVIEQAMSSSLLTIDKVNTNKIEY